MPEITDPGLLQQLNTGPTQKPRQQVPGVIYGRPKQVDPYTQSKDAFSQDMQRRDQAIQEEKARRDQMEWDATHLPDGTPKPNANSPMSATQLDLQAKKEGAQKRSETVRALMGQVRSLYESNIKGQPLERGFGATEYIDKLPGNEQFTSKAAAILPLIRPLVAQTAKEGDSDKEMQVFMSYIPTADDSDPTIEGKLNSLEILLGGMVDGKLPSQTENELRQVQPDQSGNVQVGGKTYHAVNPTAPTDGAPPANPPQGGPGFFSRNFMGGVGDVVQEAGDVAGIVINPLNTAVNNVLGTDLTTDFGKYLRDASGLPQGDSQMASAVNRFGIGALVPAGAASQVRNAPAAVQGILDVVGQRPITQGISGMAAGAASEKTRQEGGGPVAQGVAALGGGLAGFGGTNALARTGERFTSAPNALLQAADRQGVNMLPADVGGAATRRVTSAAAQAPVSASPVINAAKQAQEQIGNASRRAAQSQGQIMAADEVGQEVRKAGELYIKSETARIGNMYTRAGEAAKGVRIKPLGAVQEIDGQIARLSEMGQTNAPLINALTKLKEDISGGISVQGLRDARTALSQGVFDGKLRSNQEKAMYRGILDTLSTDIEAGLRQAGRDGAANAFKRADMLWKERIQQIDEVLEPVIGKNKSGEDILRAVEGMSRGTSGGISRLNRLLREMPKEQAGNVRATLIDRLGKASAGAQDETGDVFSASTFLTNWSKMSPKAKNALFGSEGDLRRNLDDIAKIASSVKEAGKYANSSNTAGAVVGNVGGIIGVGAYTSPWVIPATLGSQYATGRLMASPAFARWLAKAPTTPNMRYIERLGVIATQEPQVANDARALQQHLMQTFEQSPSRAAASEKEQDRRPPPPANR